MKAVPLTAYPRALTRRAGAKKLRSQGRVPAVVYGRQAQPQNLEINRTDLKNLIHHSVSENILLDLSVPEDARAKRLVMLQEIQHHALSGAMLHVDFHEVAENEKVTIMVPVETTGEAVGVKTGGGILEHVLFKVKVRGLPKDLPEVIMLDVSHLEIGQAIHIGDIKPPPGVEILGDKHISVIAIAAPMTEEQELAAEAEAAAAVIGDVEMIKEKKEEGEEGAAPAGKGVEKPAGKGAEKPSGKAGEKAPEKGAEKAPAPDKAPEKGAEKKPEKKK